MEHIVQFAIGVDDAAIRKHVEESAYDDIVTALAKDAMELLPKRYGGRIDWNRIANEVIEDFLERNRDEVLNMAADRLYESMRRTKAVKDAVAKAVQ